MTVTVAVTVKVPKTTPISVAICLCKATIPSARKQLQVLPHSTWLEDKTEQNHCSLHDSFWMESLTAVREKNEEN